MNDEASPPVKSLGNYPDLREYPLQYDFLQLIPTRAQKGISTFDLDLTCVDADGHYVVLGSNVGLVYLYDRRNHRLSRLRNEHKDTITTVKILISLECLVVCGSRSGYVTLFKVPFDETEQTEKFSVDGLHNSPITSLEWAENGLKVFSGDENGVVVCTEVDYFEHQSRSRILMDEQNKIVQLSYSKSFLIVSTLFRSLIYSFENNSCAKIGQKERKCFGPFGAIITHFNNSSEGVIFASRPGQRLWKSDKMGIIQETMIFKTAISEPHATIPLENEDTKLWNFSDFQFGLLKTYLDDYLVVYSDTSVILIDPEQKSIVASCPKLDPIVDVCTANDEIFILRGLRNLIRISSYPDPYICDKVPVEQSLIEELLVPFKELSTFVKERSDSLAIQSENANIFDWLRKKRSASTPSVFIEDNSSMQDGISSQSEVLPRVIQLKSEEVMPVVVDNESLQPLVPAIKISSTDEADDIVYKRLKKKKNKRVRFRSKSPKKDKKPSEPHPKEETTDGNVNSVNKTDQVSPVCDNLKPNKLPEELTSDLSSGASTPTGDTNSLNENSHDQTPVISILDPSSTDIPSEKLNNNQIPEENNLNQNTSDIPIETANNKNLTLEPSMGEDVLDHKNNNSESELKENDPDDIYLSFDPTTPVPELKSSISEDHGSLTSEELSVASGDSSETEPPKYGVEWVEYKAPEMLMDLSISEYHIYCVDVKNQLYISHYPVLGMHWVELSQPAEKVAVSPSDIIIWVLYKGTIYTAIQKSATKWKDVEWVSIARDVVSIAVEDDCGWYVNSTGALMKQPNLSESEPYSYPESVQCNFPILQIACRDKILWGLGDGGRLYCWNSQIKSKKSKSKWKTIEFEEDIEIDSITLGDQQTGWIIDSNGIIRFIIGVTPESPEGLGKPWEVEASKYLFRATSQFQNAVMKALNNETFSSMIKGKQHISLSTSSHGVWFCKTFDNLVYANRKGIIGHMWESFIPVGTSLLTKWNFVSASGLSSSQESLWCVNASGDIFCIFLATNILVAVESPNVAGIKCLVPSVHSLWLLSEDGSLYIRRGITPNCLQGVWWQNLDLSQLGSEKMTHVSCSPEVTWACSSEGRVYVRFGTLCPSSDRKLPQAWIHLSSEMEVNVSPIADTLSLIGKKFPLPLMHQSTTEMFFYKVYVGPLGFPVWALDNNRTVFVREGVSNNFPIGKKWTCVPELKAKDLCISRNAVWLLKSSGKIFRRFGVSEKSPCGDYWKQIPGIMNSLSVTEDDDLWGIKDEFMFRHSSFHLNCEPNDGTSRTPARSISEDDWEDIMAETSDDEM